MKNKIYFILIFINFIIKKIEANFTFENNNLSNYDASLQLFEEDKVIDKIYLNLINISKSILSDIKFSYTGKIFYLNDYSQLNILKDNLLNFRIKWIFMFDSIKEISIFVYNLRKRNIEFYANVIIISKDLYEQNNKDFRYLANLRIFIFYLENEIFNYTKTKYDYRTTKENIYARLISINDIEYNLTHLYCLILLCLIILIICVVTFRYNINLDQRNIQFFFIRIVYFFPIIKISITLLFLMKLHFLQIHNDLFNIGKSSIITFIINSLNILFKSLSITFGIFVSKGIDVALNISSREDLFNFTKRFIIAYFFFSTTILNNKFLSFFPKFYFFFNLTIETFAIFLINHEYKSTKILLMRELNLAILYFNEYINSIEIKTKMILWHWRIHLLYYILFIAIIVCLNIYKHFEIEKEIYFHFLDVLLIFSYCLIYKPRIWPLNFDINLKNDFHYFDHIYTYKITFEDVNDIIEKKDENALNNNFNSNDNDNERIKLKISETIQLRNKNEIIKENILKNYYLENNNFPIVVIGPKYYLSLYKSGNNKYKQDIFSTFIKNSSIGFN